MVSKLGLILVKDNLHSTVLKHKMLAYFPILLIAHLHNPKINKKAHCGCNIFLQKGRTWITRVRWWTAVFEVFILFAVLDSGVRFILVQMQQSTRGQAALLLFPVMIFSVVASDCSLSPATQSSDILLLKLSSQGERKACWKMLVVKKYKLCQINCICKSAWQIFTIPMFVNDSRCLKEVAPCSCRP